MRTFIGINFSSRTKEDIGKVQSMIGEHAVKGRFKYIGNFHLTLKFLGEIAPEKVGDINRVLAVCAEQNKSFELRIGQLGYFEGRNKKDGLHALWLGFSGETNKLKGLFMDVEEGLHQVGFKKEGRPYTPHITLAQDIILALPFEELHKKVDFQDFQPIAVDKIELIKSEENKGKRLYTPISSFLLK